MSDSIEQGVAALDRALRECNGKIIVCGHSEYEGDIRDVVKAMVFDD